LVFGRFGGNRPGAIRARDFEGALKSIRGASDAHRRSVALFELAEALARAGERTQAFDVLHEVDSGYRWPDDHDSVQLRWIDHLLESGDLGRVGRAIQQLKTKRYRPDGLRKLAVAYANSGDAARAAEQFRLALDAAADVTDDRDRAQAFWQIAEGQPSVGKTNAAKETIRRLVETVQLKDPWAKYSALREAAVLAAKANDQQTARRLFGRAIKAAEAINGSNYDITQVAVAQARVGHIDDALKTAWIIKHNQEDFAQDASREEALCAIAVEQVKANDVGAAVRTAMSIEYFREYRDDAIHKIIDRQIAQRDLKAALTAAHKIDNPSRKATAILTVATAYAKSGDRKTAAEVGARIELSPEDSLRKDRFDYRQPVTWGVNYHSNIAFTVNSYLLSVERTAELAGAAMGLAQALGQRPAQPYAIVFNGIGPEAVIRSLARAHAAAGDPRDALAWAKQVGSSAKVSSKRDRDTRCALERRVFALLGVAEGMLDPSSKMPAGPTP
jgi:tetratricopeptide (TPR) repeat protein